MVGKGCRCEMNALASDAGRQVCRGLGGVLGTLSCWRYARGSPLPTAPSAGPLASTGGRARAPVPEACSSRLHRSEGTGVTCAYAGDGEGQMSDLSNSEGSARRKLAEKLACQRLRPGLMEPAATCLLLPNPGFSGRRAAVGPQYPAGPGRSEVMEVAPLSPCSGRRPEPRPGLRGGKCLGMCEAQILEDQGLRPKTEVDTSYPSRSSQDPSLKGRVDLMGSMEMWTLRNARCKPERGRGRAGGGSHPAGSWLSGRDAASSRRPGSSDEGGRSAGPRERGRRPQGLL